jgi:hypothetical protein
MQTEDARRMSAFVGQSPVPHALLNLVELKSIKTKYDLAIVTFGVI